ncbi:MAG: sigma 54-interacting transcriptional regulator [Syntrophothermus sp.]
MLINRPINVLLIEDEDYDVRRVKNTVRPFEDKINIQAVVSSGIEAIDLLKENSKNYDVVIMDFQIAGGLMGETLISNIREIDPLLQIIVITKMTINITDFKFANDLLKAGAFWYCTKYPGDIVNYIYQPTDFILSIFNAFEKKKLEQERYRSNKKLSRNVDDILLQKKIIGTSRAIEDLKLQIQKCSKTNTNILINGQSGTGKELVAANIHYLSERRFENFVAINCGSLPHDLIESELFGYEKGSFTGASKSKPGLFEQANNGTIFLDEIAELPLNAQVKLLRVLQEGEIEKIGRTAKVKIDVRIIAATNRDLGKEVSEKRFREDLYYRLNVVPITVPTLRDRLSDIPMLIDHFLDYFCDEIKRPKPEIEPEAMKMLMEYDWPGNVRELKNIVQRLLFYVEDKITPGNIKQSLIALPANSSSSYGDFANLFQEEDIIPLKQAEAIFREQYFKFVRDISKSDAKAAEKLGLAPPNFHRMCKDLGLK